MGSSFFLAWHAPSRSFKFIHGWMYSFQFKSVTRNYCIGRRTRAPKLRFKNELPPTLNITNACWIFNHHQDTTMPTYKAKKGRTPFNQKAKEGLRLSIQKLIATENETANNKNNSPASSHDADFDLTVSSDPFPPNDDDASWSEEQASHSSSEHDEDFFPDDGGFLYLEDPDDHVIEFSPFIVEGSSTPPATVPPTSDDPPAAVTLRGDDQGEELPPTSSSADPSKDLTDLELASLELLTLCDDSGARRGLYNELLSLLRRFREEQVDITKAKSRDLLVRDLGKKVNAPKSKSVAVGGRNVLHFPFIESLRDLLRSGIFDDIENLCVNQATEDRFSRFQASTPEDYGEVMSRSWAAETQDSIEDFDPDFDLFIGVMLYGDKTGTDVNQRYPLEPWVFTLILLRKAAREKHSSWRHLGFIPSQD